MNVIGDNFIMKNLSLSISLEAAELLELFQWKTPEEVVQKNKKG